MPNRKGAVIVASFGTSHNDSRKKTIDAIELAISDAVRKEFPYYEAFRAFTSDMIIRKLFERDGITVRDVSETIERLAGSGFRNIVIQPTNIINGFEYDGIVEAAKCLEASVKRLKCGLPLLFYNSAEDSVSGAVKVAEILIRENEALALDEGTAVVMIGHGTEHKSGRAYELMEAELRRQGGKNYFMGTIEGGGAPEITLKRLREAGYSRAVLIPFMIVAGEHAVNDIAGLEGGSWKSIFERAGIACECVEKGLGEYEKIRGIFAEKALKLVRED